jgi:two-component system sensor histidine kinase CiaH
MIRSARVELTLAYTAGIALMMAVFSIALYIALASAIAGNLEVGGNAGPNVERAVQSAELARARVVLVGVNLVGWVVSAAVSYFVAGRTLRPIEAAVERQRQFTAHAAHELRTPLTVMKTETDVTLSRERSREEYRQTLSLVNAEVEYMERAVNDLLALARVEANPSALERERRRVSEAVVEAVAPFVSRLNERNIHVITDVPDHLMVALDWERVGHLLRNLLDNAVRHTAHGGEIRITAREDNDNLEFAVFNSGLPIPDRDLPQLLIPFYRGRGKAGNGGSGLGLALADWVARAHGGSITAHNRTEGVEFTVRLPTVFEPRRRCRAAHQVIPPVKGGDVA